VSEHVFFADVATHRAKADLLFATVAGRLRELVPNAIIEHVGSTSLRDGLTKGDLDVQVRVAPGAYDAACAALAAIYEANPGGFTEDGRSFKDDSTDPPLGVHVTIIAGPSDIQHRQRDLLRARPDLRAEYDAIKRAFHAGDMTAYREAKDAFFTRIRPGVTLRRFDPSDSIPALTEMLHRAYADLARRGMRFLASHQDDDKTRERVLCGETIVAVIDGRIVGTITVRPPGDYDDPYYARADVASLEQLAVDPDYQGRGIGRKLMDEAECVARSWGMKELAADTSNRAAELVTMYAHRGYRLVGELGRDIVNYRSVLFSKTL